MSKWIIRADGYDPHSGSRTNAHPPTAVMRDLQYVHLSWHRNRPFNVAGQKDASPTCIQKQNNRVVILIIPPRDPIRGRMQNRERSDFLAGGDPSNRDLLFLNLIEQIVVPRDHRVAS